MSRFLCQPTVVRAYISDHVPGDDDQDGRSGRGQHIKFRSLLDRSQRTAVSPPSCALLGENCWVTPAK